MTDFSRWQDVRGDIVAGAGGEEAVATRRRNQAYIDGRRLAERHKALGLTWAQGAEKMGAAKSRVSQVEPGEGGEGGEGGAIQISAVFGDDHYILRGTVTEAA
jgi:hypothetical protein